MKRIIFSAVCMLISTSGIISMLCIALSLHQSLGSINGSTSFFTYLDWLNITPFFLIFCTLGISAFFIGVWEAFKKEIKDGLKRIQEEI